ncbi:MAG: cell division protein ZapA [Wolbachia sp.]|nr:cell division protein ZapA [Wolbachia sp.]MDD9336143.1 cell division protein ZapA [Wolbachia sp.]
MQILGIVIRNNKYTIACESEKKGRVLHLVNNFDKRVSSISQKIGGNGSDALNFLLAAITLEGLQRYKNGKKIEYTEVLNRINKIIANLE